jgi:hypothetical protein
MNSVSFRGLRVDCLGRIWKKLGKEVSEECKLGKIMY